MRNHEQSIARAVKEYIELHPTGEPVATSELLGLGTRAAIDQALWRMTKVGTLERVTSGLYVRPRVSKDGGKAMATPEQIVRAASRSTRSLVKVHGAEAAREFGLSTQVPVQPCSLRRDGLE